MSNKNVPLEDCVFFGVTAVHRDESTVQEYLSWLIDGHLQVVLAAGAIEGRVIQLDNRTVETQYLFPSQGAYDRYEREYAQPLREEGISLFGERGVQFKRRSGSVCIALTPSTMSIK